MNPSNETITNINNLNEPIIGQSSIFYSGYYFFDFGFKFNLLY